jgi:hypothetical protein
VVAGPGGGARQRIAALQELLVEIAVSKEQQRARLKHAEEQAEATRQAYGRRLDAIVSALGAGRLPASLLQELRSETLLDVFGAAELGLLERIREWSASRRIRRR